LVGAERGKGLEANGRLVVGLVGAVDFAGDLSTEAALSSLDLIQSKYDRPSAT